MRRLTLLVAIAAVIAPAQTRVNATRPMCKGAQAQIYAELPARIGGETTVLVPMCITVGTGFVIDTLTEPPTLRAQPSVIPPAPWMAIDKIELPPLAIPNDQAYLNYTLTRTPIEGSALIAVLQGRPYGLVEVVPAAKGKEVVITLPAAPRPFAEGEAIILVYLTTDPRLNPAAR